MPSQHVVLPYPDGGMDEIMPSHLIRDNQFSELVNWYYDSAGRLVSRPGTEFIHRFTDPVFGMGCFQGTSLAVQSGTVLYGRSSATNHAMTSLKTGVVSGERFFANMNSAIYSGTTAGSSTNDNLKWTPTTTSASVWSGSPPALSYLCVWNSRMWGVHRNERTKLYYSKVGDPDDWTSTGVSGSGFIDIGYSDGDHITGLVAHNEQLFVLKESSIWHIVTGNPNTDNSLWRVEFVTKNFGCSSHRGIVISGTDVMVPSAFGYVSLNAALYQGDFKAASASLPIDYRGGGSACYVPALNQYLYCVSWKPEREIYCLERTGQNARWMKMDIRDNNGEKLQPWLVAGGWSPPNAHGKFYSGPFISGVYSLICLEGVEIVQYPSTYEGSAGHYDYIDGPLGRVPIRKYMKTKSFNFGNFAHDKRSRYAVATFTKREREAIVDGDEMTISTIFDGDTNRSSAKTINDQGTDIDDCIRTAVIGVGGSEGQVFKTIQYEHINNVGGYELEYGGIELDVETQERYPRPSAKVLS